MSAHRVVNLDAQEVTERGRFLQQMYFELPEGALLELQSTEIERLLPFLLEDVEQGFVPIQVGVPSTLSLISSRRSAEPKKKALLKKLIGALEPGPKSCLLRRERRVSSFYRSHRLSRARAIVFNNYFQTAGGGERSSLDHASALSHLGYEIILATTQPIDMTLQQIVEPFGIEVTDTWSLKEFNGVGEMQDFIRQEKIEIFLNHTFGSFIPNVAPIGIYCTMFPHRVDETYLTNLRTYDVITSISRFTEGYVKLRWSDSLRSAVLVPPISRVHTSQKQVQFEEKEKLLLNVGRFNVHGHSKHQLKAIESFIEARKRGVFDDSWKFVLIGQINENDETLEYLEDCKALASGHPIQIYNNLDIDSLCSYYRRASFLLHFTGYGSKFGETPEKTEHLGLVALDCFAYGVLPILYHRGGAATMIRHGVDGFVFKDVDDLQQLLQKCSTWYKAPLHRVLFEASKKRSIEFDAEHFTGQLEALLSTLRDRPRAQETIRA